MSRLSAVILPEYDGKLSVENAYRKSLQQILSVPFQNEGIGVSFGDSQIASLAVEQEVFEGEEHGNSFDDADRTRLCLLLNDALAEIADLCPRLADLIKLITAEVVFISSDRVGGGTSSHLPGVICLSPDINWTKSDVAECLIHEATHLTTFLCDMVFRLYMQPVEKLDQRECKVLSAVRVGQYRPLDKALHSGLVSVPIMFFQNERNVDEFQKKFGEPLVQCSNGLLEKKEYFTEYGWSVVKDLACFCDRLDMKIVEESLEWSDSRAMQH